VIYLLDTNILSAAINGNAVVIAKLETAFEEGHVLALSAISYFEVVRGLNLPKYSRKYGLFKDLVSRLQMMMLELNTFDIAARLYQELRGRGIPLEDADLLIASCALEHGAVVVTDNAKHFARVPRIQMENWVEREQ
jgi:tRNA(fMet)-specific endonuclease VapC